MANYNIWPGSASLAEVSQYTNFGFYNSDVNFISESIASTKWAASRLGYPVNDVELTNSNFISAFEEAVNEYSAMVNANNIKEYMFLLQGSSKNVNLTGREIRGGLGRIIKLVDAYGAEVGAGGDVSWKTGSIMLTSGTQVYDLNTLFAAASESGNSIRIKRIFHDREPAQLRQFDPMGISSPIGISGIGNLNGLSGGGSLGYPGTSYILRPVYEDVLRMQAIEFNDQIRRSAYTFEIINNQLRIFPIPKQDFPLWFHYVVKNESDIAYTSGSVGEGKITDPADIPYQNIIYSNINSVGRQWIRRYFLALCKITMGGIRAKFTNIPIPGSEVSLDGESLRNEGTTERTALIEELRDMLEKSGKKNQLANKQEEDENIQKILSKIPLGIFVM